MGDIKSILNGELKMSEKFSMIGLATNPKKELLKFKDAKTGVSIAVEAEQEFHTFVHAVDQMSLLIGEDAPVIMKEILSLSPTLGRKIPPAILDAVLAGMARFPAMLDSVDEEAKHFVES